MFGGVRHRSPSEVADRIEAQELDLALVDTVRQRTGSIQSLARILARTKKTRGFRTLGYRSMAAYAKARGIGRTYGYGLARVYELLSNAGIKERDWSDISPAKLICCIGILNRENAPKILDMAGRMTRRGFEDTIRDMNGKRPKLPRGTYRLEPCEVRPGQARNLRSVRGEVYETAAGERILIVP